jgi:hypothetical protein
MSIFRSSVRRISTMTQYIFLLHAAPETFAGLSLAEFNAIKSKYAKWRDQMIAEGRVAGGNKLEDGSGRIIRGSNVTDGPYTEAKEVVGGLFIIEAHNYDDAVAVAATCPHIDYGTLEVRAIEVVG